jgi:hypothetical protein
MSEEPLDPGCPMTDRFTLHRDAAGRLVLTDSHGEVHTGVEPVRPFPVSEPDRLISFLDSQGREIACVADLTKAPSELAKMIRQELYDREFMPQILRIVNVKMSKEPHEWEVVTDRGPVHFLMRDDDVRRLGPHRAIFVDVHGVRYYLPDSRELDKKSRRVLSQYL